MRRVWLLVGNSLPVKEESWRKMNAQSSGDRVDRINRLPPH